MIKAANNMASIPAGTAANRTDEINSPPHYQSEKGIECIDAIEAALSAEEFRGYLRGNALKYQWRAMKKHASPLKDLEKSQWYLDRLRKHLTG
jgi:hypothetical protein